MATYKPLKEVVLYGTGDTIRVPEIRVRYNRGKTFTKISDSKDTYRFLLKVYGRDIDIQEQIVILFLDQAINVLGYYKHTIGTPVASVIDVPMIMGVAVQTLARAMILSHNHPSGNVKPSESDRDLTGDISKAAKILRLKLFDHIIVTKNNGYFSFADHDDPNLAGFGTNELTVEQQLRKEILLQLSRVNPDNAPKVYQLIQTECGYRDMEQRIIGMVVRDRITPSACIPQIENEL